MCHTKRADDLRSPHPGANGDARARGKPLRVVPAMRRAGAGRCCGRTRERTGRAQGEGREKGKWQIPACGRPGHKEMGERKGLREAMGPYPARIGKNSVAQRGLHALLTAGIRRAGCLTKLRILFHYQPELSSFAAGRERGGWSPMLPRVSRADGPGRMLRGESGDPTLAGGRGV